MQNHFCTKYLLYVTRGFKKFFIEHARGYTIKLVLLSSFTPARTTGAPARNTGASTTTVRTPKTTIGASSITVGAPRPLSKLPRSPPKLRDHCRSSQNFVGCSTQICCKTHFAPEILLDVPCGFGAKQILYPKFCWVFHADLVQNSFCTRHSIGSSTRIWCKTDFAPEIMLDLLRCFSTK